MTDLPETYTSSDGRITPIRQMGDRHLGNAHAKRVREHGDDDPIAQALMREIESRGGSHNLGREAPASDRTVAASDNQPSRVDDRAEFKARLEESDGAQALLERLVKIELAASLLPAADQIKTDADVARIDVWVGEASQLGRDAKDFHDDVKAPYLMRGAVIDEFEREIRQALQDRMGAMQARKRGYLAAKAEREKQEREAAAEASRKAAAEQLAKAEAARRAQAEAENAAALAQKKLADAEAERQAREASALAQAEADESAPDLTSAEEAAGVVDAAEAELRTHQLAAFQHQDDAEAAAQAAASANMHAFQAEQAAAVPTHQLAKAGESGLKAVWKARVDDAAEFYKSALGLLAPYFGKDEIDTALQRAAKASIRPPLGGVTFYEDYEVTTNTRRRR